MKGIYKQVLDEDYEKVGEGHLTGEHRVIGAKDGSEFHRRRRQAQKAYVSEEFCTSLLDLPHSLPKE